jgi:hypothetical protein
MSSIRSLYVLHLSKYSLNIYVFSIYLVEQCLYLYTALALPLCPLGYRNINSFYISIFFFFPSIVLCVLSIVKDINR